MKRNAQVLLFTLLSFNAVPYILGFYPTNHHHTFRQQYPSLLMISSTRVKRTETSSCNIYKEDLLTEGPPISSKPDYSQIHSPLGALVDNFFLYIFRVQFAKNLGVDSRFPRSDFRGIIELVNALNSRYSDKETIQQLSMDIISELKRKKEHFHMQPLKLDFINLIQRLISCPQFYFRVNFSSLVL